MHRPFDAGMHAFERGAFQYAIRYFQDALGEDPGDAMAHAMISIALSNVGRRHAALVEAQRAISLNPELALAHVAEAYAHVLHDDDPAARRCFDRALALEPMNAAARLGLCRLARARRDADALEEALARYRALAPEDPEGDVLEAHLHLLRGRLDEAERSARAALRADPEDADGFVALGWVHARRGSAAEAKAMALAALGLAPDDREAHMLLAHAVMLQRPILGYWQRFSLWLSLGGELRIVAVLIGIWVAYRVGVVLFDEGGMTAGVAAMQIVWLGFVAVTWIAGFQYRSMVERELQRAELDPDY